MRDKIVQMNKQIKWSVTLANANQLFQEWRNIVIYLDNGLTLADNQFNVELGNKDNEFMRRPFWQTYMTPTRDTATQEKLEENTYKNAQIQQAYLIRPVKMAKKMLTKVYG